MKPPALEISVKTPENPAEDMLPKSVHSRSAEYAGATVRPRDSGPFEINLQFFAESGKTSTGYTYWSESIQFEGNKVYQRNDLFDPMQVSSWTRKGETITGTNIERMAAGNAPIGYDGKLVQLHHLLQTQDGPIVEVSQTFHNNYYSTIHINTGQLPSTINRSHFNS